VGEVGLGAQSGVTSFPNLFEVVEAHGEEAGFHLTNAVEAPAGDDHVFDQDLFDRADRLAFVLEGLAELLEIGLLFDGGQNDFGGGEAVLEGVEADGGASFGSFWAVALLSVAAIGCELAFGDHSVFRIQRRERGIAWF
jgi:hypothetical protein